LGGEKTPTRCDHRRRKGLGSVITAASIQKKRVASDMREKYKWAEGHTKREKGVQRREKHGQSSHSYNFGATQRIHGGVPTAWAGRKGKNLPL